MTLKKKMYLILGITTTLMIVSLGISGYLIVIKSFARIERTETVQNIERASGSLNTESLRMQSVLMDWAFWDDTYQFVEDANKKYIDSNMMDDTFSTLGINYFIVVDNQSRIIYQKSIDFQKKQTIPLSTEWERVISSPALHTSETSTSPVKTGFLMTNGNPVLFTAGPILNSKKAGPSHGTLILGKDLNREWVEKISGTLSLSINLFPWNGKTFSGGIQTDSGVLPLFSGIRVIPRDQNIISGYAMMRDFEDHPAFLLGVDVPREVYHHAKATFYYYLFSLIGVILLFVSLTVVLLERQILSRIMRLGKDVRSVGVSGDRSARVNVQGNDELTLLSGEINRMLENLRHSETSLRDSENRFMMLFENIPVMVVSFDRRGKCLLWNKECSRVMGWSPEELNSISDPLSLAIEDRMELKKVKRILLRADGLFREYTLRTKAGVLRRQMWADFLLPNKALMFIGYDITERRNLEEQLQVRQRMDSLGTLAGGIAHDFNNILTGVIGNLSLLRMTGHELNPEQQEYLNESEQACRRAGEIIRQFQVFSNGNIVKKDVVDVWAIAEEVFSFLSFTTDRMIEKKVDITPGKYFVRANASELHQVFLNLGTNSVQAIQDRGPKAGDFIRITAEIELLSDTEREGLPRGEYVHIRFEDSGGGMPEKVRKRAFEPFFSTKEKGPKKSQGLGLAMVYNIITAHNRGCIDIESIEGNGSIFHIFLPRGIPDFKTDRKVIHTPLPGKGGILVVDDEIIIRLLLKKVLQEYGYTVFLAEDGKKGVEVFSENRDRINLVILDLTMPHMTGDMVFREIRMIQPNVRIILSSGHVEGEIDESIFSQSNGFLPKPWNIPTLLQMVNKAFGEVHTS